MLPYPVMALVCLFVLVWSPLRTWAQSSDVDVATDGSAEPADDAEVRYLTGRLPTWDVEGEGVFAHYVGMDRAFVDPESSVQFPALPVELLDGVMNTEGSPAHDLMAAQPAAGGWSFEPSDIQHLVLGLTTVEHPELLEFLEFYNTEGRTRAARWFAAGAPWRAMIETIATEVGAPPELLWVAAIESGFALTVTSRAGARGMWQFMAPTGRDRGLRIDSWVDERLDPELSTRAGLQYLVDLHRTLRSWPLALAAYNAGGGHVRNEIREHDVTDFWAMDLYGCVYSASRRYALRAITLALIDRNREVFGFESFSDGPARSWETVEVAPSVRLSLVAEAAGIGLSELRDLNPSLLRGTTPPGDPWPVRIPAGAAASFIENFDRVVRRWGTEHTEVTVWFGESMDQLAQAFEVPARVLRQVNNLDSDEQPTYGSVLLVPGADRQRSLVAPPAIEGPLILPGSQWSVSDARRIFYVAHEPDRLVEVAEHFGVSVFDLAAWNNLDPSAPIHGGQILVLYVPATATFADTMYLEDPGVEVITTGSAQHQALRDADSGSSTTSTNTVRRYTVRSGDTLSDIARRHNTTVAQLRRWNDLDSDVLRAGQRLVVRR